MNRRRRRDHWVDPLPGGLRPKPLQIIELDLTADPPPTAFDRAAAQAGLQAAFATLTDDELQVARLRVLGVRLVDIGAELGLLDEEVELLWKQARCKLGTTLFGKD